jgi:hypothetical protein
LSVTQAASKFIPLAAASARTSGMQQLVKRCWVVRRKQLVSWCHMCHCSPLGWWPSMPFQAGGPRNGDIGLQRHPCNYICASEWSNRHKQRHLPMWALFVDKPADKPLSQEKYAWCTSSYIRAAVQGMHAHYQPWPHTLIRHITAQHPCSSIT